MANLDNKRIKDTYQGLIKTNDNNAISSEVVLTDGSGNSTGVSVSNDGRVVASGTVSFGSLKDTGENITITKFVDESDGIAGNDNDTTIPTTAAVKDYVDSTELNSVTSVNTQTGAVVLGTDNIAVLVQGEHLCVMSRGIGDQASGMTTSKLGGYFFHKHSVRSEFMKLALQS